MKAGVPSGTTRSGTEPQLDKRMSQACSPRCAQGLRCSRLLTGTQDQAGEDRWSRSPILSLLPACQQEPPEQPTARNSSEAGDKQLQQASHTAAPGLSGGGAPRMVFVSPGEMQGVSSALFGCREARERGCFKRAQVVPVALISCVRGGESRQGPLWNLWCPTQLLRSHSRVGSVLPCKGCWGPGHCSEQSYQGSSCLNNKGLSRAGEELGCWRDSDQ